MKMKMTFLGAARNVTGSCHCLETDHTRLLIDCGFYQERDFKSRNWDPFALTLSGIDAILLTHAHLDHCGLLPKLVKAGFKGRIICTPATGDIAEIVLLDSAHIQEEDAAYKKRRHKKAGRKSKYPDIPLYTNEDAQAAIELFETVPYNTPVTVGEDVEAVFSDAGHILGSSMIKLTVKDGEETRTLLFSGDVGRWEAPIIQDPTLFSEADYVFVESTYGDRVHKGEDTVTASLEEVINKANEDGGKILIPSFAIERAQELLYRLNELLAENRIRHMPVYLDSPMAVKVTEVFMRHPELFDEEAVALMKKGQHPCDFKELHLSRTTAQSKALNRLKGAAIYIAGSGMCTGGRIKHHLKNFIDKKDTTVIFIGYQANGTLGRIILEGAEEIRIHGQQCPVNAHITKINGFSAHADRNELMRWLDGLQKAPRKVFVIHGEEEAAESFGEHIRKTKGWEVSVPDYQDIVELD
ncbi:MBL fold metallo-hydrolase RNA specificity domain-containing protein [Planctomycetota bacterium]